MANQRTRLTLDLDPPFQRRLKVMAATKGVTMREYCLEAIERELVVDEAQGLKPLPFGEEAALRLAALQAEVFPSGTLTEDSVDLLREAREERTADLERASRS